ncbi:sterol desaturase family protein [Acidocella aromatica]|uniref:Sterol desaturase/sphingolipid hydroxylase (Fatty acid hydroxylase superfamily) n=1 Tax=Acidocella aromatica TaxID=1303579 RepID=A0A840VJX7_9PROT|nr:sterol desaturase family protein [Acidocella aromatica]MBB5373475.1 sterol desaturase/sphingolipid hydroxylase (fatty acid hydroxylase superfamily) [Acidocella aromatica]
MSLDRLFSNLAGYMDQYAVLPILYHFHWMEWDELSFDWCLVCIYGLFAVIVTYAVCLPMERWRPVEHWPDQKAVLTDVFYTLLNRVGVIPVITFLLFYQAQTWFTGWVVDMGFIPPTLDSLVPGLFGHPIITFWIYALILDCADYWRHRLSHSFRAWYALHALHHAQRQMSFWSDDRNHIFDDFITFVWFFVIGLLIGIPPLQFPLLMLGLRFIESFSHANIRMSFGPLEPILVSPRFHRLHHALRAAGRGSCNYAGVFSIWDVIFGTADFSNAYLPTGDAKAPEALATGTYLEQQLCGAKMFFQSLAKSWHALGSRRPT